MSLSEKLTGMGIVLPTVSGPFGAYVPAKRVGDLVYVAGQLPMKDGKLMATLAEADWKLRQGHNLWLIGMWFGIFMLFGLAQWKVDMVDKQVWFVVPLAVCLAAVGATWAWQRFKTPALYYGTRLVITGLILWTTYSALTLWFDRVFIKRR